MFKVLSEDNLLAQQAGSAGGLRSPLRCYISDSRSLPLFHSLRFVTSVMFFVDVAFIPQTPQVE
jgi:hypothetical protein